MKAKAMIAAVVTTVLWSGSYIVNRYAFAEGVGPFTLSGLRYTIAAILLGMCMPKGKGGAALSFWQILMLAVVCYLLGQGFQYLGQSLLTPTLASMILNVGMIALIVCMDCWKLKEARGGKTYAFILLLAAGVVCFYQPWKGNAQQYSLLGIAAMLVAAVGSGLNITFNRYFLNVRRIGHKELVVKPMLAGGLIMLLYGLVSEPVQRASWRLCLCVAYLAGISGALGFFLWTWSQKTLSSVQNGCVNHFMLIEIALLDVLFFGRVITPWQWVGIVLTLSGIMGVLMMRQGNGQTPKARKTA